MVLNRHSEILAIVIVIDATWRHEKSIFWILNSGMQFSPMSLILR